MRKLILLIILLAVLAGVGLPFLKYRSVDGVINFWTQTLAGTSGFNPGKAWQDAKKTGGDIQAEAKQTPLGGFGDLLGQFGGQIAQAFGNAWSTPAKDIPAVKDIPGVSKNTGIGIALLTIGFIVFLIIGFLIAIFSGGGLLLNRFARPQVNAAKSAYNYGKSAVTNFTDDLWHNFGRFLAVVALAFWSVISYSSKGGVVPIPVIGGGIDIKPEGLPLFLVPILLLFALSKTWENLNKIEAPLIKIEDWLLIVQTISFIFLVFMTLGAIPFIRESLNVLTSLFSSVPFIGDGLGRTVNAAVTLGKSSPAFVFGIWGGIILFWGHFVFSHVKKEGGPATTSQGRPVRPTLPESETEERQ